MYRIRQEVDGVADSLNGLADVAKEQSIALLQTVTNSPNGNFDVQTHAEHISFVEEEVIPELRSHFARTSPKTPKARERHYAKLQPAILDIARYACGMSYDDIAEQTDRTAEQVQSQLTDTLRKISDDHGDKRTTFRAAYRRKHWAFHPNMYSGLLGVIKFTEASAEGGDCTSHPSETTSAPRRARRQSASENTSIERGDNFGRYLYDISHTPLLTAEQEVELAKRIEGGLVAEHALEQYSKHLSPTETEELEWLIRDGREAKDHFYVANLRLVISIARKYRVRGAMSFEDMVQEGNLGLDRAVKKFDYSKGYKFSTYATNWIKQAIARGLVQADTIRKPVHVVEELRAMSLHERNLANQGIEPTPDLLAIKLGCDVSRVHDLMEWRKDPRSLDAQLDSNKRFGGGTTLWDLVADNAGAPPDALLDEYSILERQQLLYDMLQQLDARSADMLSSYYGCHNGPPETLKDIAQRYGLSPERVRQIVDRAKRQLQGYAEADRAS